VKPVGKILIGALVVVVVGSAAFFGGMKFSEYRIIQDPSRLFQQMAGRQDGQFTFGQGGGPQGQGGIIRQQGGATTRQQGQFPGGTMGTIESVNGNVLTVETNDGRVQVNTSETTMVEKYTSVEVSDLIVGEQIVVSGSTNDDGSITARSIQSLRALPTGSSDEQPVSE